MLGASFTSLYRPGRLWGRPNLLSNLSQDSLARWVKLQGREADYSSSSAEVRTSTFPYVFMA
jgi:hypothetical protein